MSIAANLVSLGFPAKWADYLGAFAGTVVPTGNNSQASAQSIVPFTTVLADPAATLNSLLLPQLRATKFAPTVVFNIGTAATNLYVFPASGEHFRGAAADAGITIAAGGISILWPCVVTDDVTNSCWARFDAV